MCWISRVGSVSVTPMRVTGMPRCSQRPMNLTSSSRPTETKTRAWVSENRAAVVEILLSAFSSSR